MDIKKLTPEVRQIWRVAKVVRAAYGLAMGIELFIWAPLYYETVRSISDPKTGMLITTIFLGITNALRVFLEVPTGAIADAIGRKKATIWSFVFGSLYFSTLAFLPFARSISFVLVVGMLSSIFWAVGYTLFSGTFTAWCVDSLREKAPNIGYEQLLAKAYTYYFIGEIFGGILGVSLYLWKLPAVALLLASAACAFCVVFCLGEMEDEETLQYLDIKKVSLSAITKRMGEIVGVGFQIFRKSSVIFLLVLVFASYMFVLNIVEILWPVYLRSKIAVEVQPFYWLGLVVVTFSIGALGSHSMALFSKRLYDRPRTVAHNIWLRRLFIGTCLFASIPILVLSWFTDRGIDNFWIFSVAILPVQFCVGLVIPCFETLINNYIPDNQAQERATIISFGSLFRSLLIMLLSVPAGGSSGEKTAVGWAIPAFLLLVTALVGNYFLKRAQNRVADVLESRVVPVSPIAADEVQQ